MEGGPEILYDLSRFREPPRRILCTTVAGMGDLIMIAPAIQSIHERYPEAEISFLAHYNRGGHEVASPDTGD